MKIKKLGVNIDHVATIRNARDEIYPSPVKAAILAQKSGADSITIHLREDRRHIRDNDLKIIKNKIRIPINLEMAPTQEMLKIATKFKPEFACIVPEKRREVTTEGGLNIKKNSNFIKKVITKLKKKNIRVSLFIEPTIEDVKIAKSLGADCIEKKMEKKHLNKISALLKKSEIKNIKPDSFKRYGSARKLYNFNIDNVSSY